MNGFIRLRGRSTLVLGLALLCVPTSLQGQTAGERMREEEVRQRMEEARLRYREATLRYQEEAQEARARAQEQLRKAQQVVVRVRSRVRLGVSLDGAQGDDTDRQGARIQSIIEGSPAEEAGLQEGDIITHLNGQSLLAPLSEEGEKTLGQEESLPVQRLMALAQKLDAGDEVEVRYLRDGQPRTVSFEAAEIDDPSFMVLRGERGDSLGVFRFNLPELEGLERLEDLNLELRDLNRAEPNVWFRSLPEGPMRGYALGEGDTPFVYSVLGGMTGFGLRLTEMNPGLSEYFSTDKGLLVLDVDEESTLGLLPGDVILSIDGRTVEDQGDVRRILGSYEDDETVSFILVRKGRELTVEGTIR